MWLEWLKRTEITQTEKSQVAKQKHRDERGRFVKENESIYCVSLNPHSKISRDAIKYFEFMIKRARERDYRDY